MELKPLSSPFTYEPVLDYIQVDYSKPTESGGLLLPPGARTPIAFLTLRAKTCGPLCKWVKPGDLMLLATMSIMEVMHDGNACAFTQESKIMAIAREKPSEPGDNSEPLKFPDPK